MARKSFEEEALKHFKERGMTARLWQDEADSLLHVLAKPDLGCFATPLNYTVPHWTTKRPAWHNCWWARFGRWVNERVFRKTRTSFKSPFPRWFLDLLYTYEVDLRAKTEALPLDVLERIRVMQNYVAFYIGEEPTKVVMGRRAFVELKGVCINHFPDALTFSQSGSGFHVFGLKMQMNPFLAEDAVLVC